jgi:hypothetical protein
LFSDPCALSLPLFLISPEIKRSISENKLLWFALLFYQSYRHRTLFGKRLLFFFLLEVERSRNINIPNKDCVAVISLAESLELRGAIFMNVEMIPKLEAANKTRSAPFIFLFMLHVSLFFHPVLFLLRIILVMLSQAYLDFFEKRPQSFVTAYYLSLNVLEMNQGTFPTDSLQAYYNRFTKLSKRVGTEKIVEELAKRKVAMPSTEAFTFAKTDLKGQPLSLSSFRGKYILLEF